MDFGVAIFSTDETVGPGEVAKLAEERGFESIFFTDHTHIPAGRESRRGELDPKLSENPHVLLAQDRWGERGGASPGVTAFAPASPSPPSCSLLLPYMPPAPLRAVTL